MGCRLVGPTGRIGSRQQLAGGMSWGCSGAVQRSCGNHLHPVQLEFQGNPYFENLADFPVCMWICGGLARCGASDFSAPKRHYSEKDMSFGNPPHHGTEKLRTFQKILSRVFFTFHYFWGSKSGVLCLKVVFLGVLDRV